MEELSNVCKKSEIERPKARYTDDKGLGTYLTVGRTKALQIGKDADARIKIGGCTRYDLVKIDAYLESLRG